MSAPSPPTPKIAILGAGPAGLTLALILLHNSTPIPATNLTIFELDASPHARSQGGSLDLHESSGQAALKAAGLFEEFKKYARYEGGQDFTIVDERNRMWMETKDEDTGRPEIDRERLREILVRGVPEGVIRWGCKVKTVLVEDELPTPSSSKTRIILATGEEFTGFDLIVGADGAWSKVRSLLTSVKPFYSGISGYELTYLNFTAKHPELSAMVGRGSYFSLGDGKCLLIQRQGNGDIKVVAALHKPESWLKDLHANSDKGRQELLKEYADAGFAPELQDLIKAADDDSTTWPFYMLPVGLRWRHRRGLTMVGDAAHLMTPFAGEGVNNAMADSLSLAKFIINRHDRQNSQDGQDSHDCTGLDEAVKAYEQEMFARVTPSMAKTWENLQQRFFTEESARLMSERLRGINERRRVELQMKKAGK